MCLYLTLWKINRPFCLCSGIYCHPSNPPAKWGRNLQSLWARKWNTSQHQRQLPFQRENKSHIICCPRPPVRDLSFTSSMFKRGGKWGCVLRQWNTMLNNIKGRETAKSQLWKNSSLSKLWRNHFLFKKKKKKLHPCQRDRKRELYKLKRLRRHAN